MKFFSVRFVFFFFLSSWTLVNPGKLLASKESSDREVRLTYVQGDVRLSRGDSKGPNLKKPWEQAQAGEFVQEGFALATGSDGRTEVEFEDGSTVYLAEDSLLLFTELSSGIPEESKFDPELIRTFCGFNPIISQMTLATGTATFALQPTKTDSFCLETPADRIHLSFPETFFARVQAYLDATTITPQSDQGELMRRPGLTAFRIAKGQSLSVRDGEILEFNGPVSASVRIQEIEAGVASFGAFGFSPAVNKELMQEALSIRGASHGSMAPLEAPHTQARTKSGPQEITDWDAWVFERVQQRASAIQAALKASGLSTPVSGLVDLYEYGKFFDCPPYGRCWEADEPDSLDPDSIREDLQQPATPSAASPSQTTGTFQPQTVQWQERWAEPCGPGIVRAVSRIAHTPEELQKLLRKKQSAERSGLGPLPYSAECYGYWIPHRGHFARILTPQAFNAQPIKCTGKRCKPIHPPRPLWMKVNGKVGFVPAHPNDVKGRPPLNLKLGAFFPSRKPGDPVRRVDVDPSRRITVLDKVPREFRGESNLQAVRVSAPEIHGHLMQQATAWNKSLPDSARAHPSITYDYKSGQSLMAGSSVGGARTHEIAVGGISSHGSTYSGGGQAYGGGHYSAGSHSGSYSSGSYSYGSSSSGSSSSHSSSGGWSSGSSSSSSSAGSSSPSSSSSSGGGSRGRP